MARPASLTAPLVDADNAVLARQRPPAPARLAGELDQLQRIEGDVIPAVRIVAARAGHPLSAARAWSDVEQDRRAPALAELLTGWQQLYGAFIIVGQAAA